MAKLILEAAGRVDELNEQLHALQEQDEIIETKKRKAGVGCACVGAAFAASVAAAALSGGHPAAVAALVVFLVGFIVMIVVTTRYSSLDLEDRKLDVAQKLFEVVGKDIPPKAKCRLTVSFQPYQKHGVLVSKEGGAFSRVVQKVYEDEWFKARGALYDGNQFQVSIKQTVKRKEKRKRKYTKVKERFTETLTLTLTLDAESYPGFAEAGQHVDASASIEGLAIKSVSQTDNKLKIAAAATSTTGEELITGDKLLKLFLHVYQGLAACRAKSA